MVIQPASAIGSDATNEAHPWDDFDPIAYSSHNYDILHDEDHELLKRIRDYFADVTQDRRQGTRHGIDLGAGPNLYPSLAMLPFCKEITLAERGRANRQWLTKQITGANGYDRSWDQFWDVLRTTEPYDRVEDPRRELRSRVRVQYYDVFRPRKNRSWDIGTMFFVAESITKKPGEFQEATRNFVKTLRIKAPFAAAFMRNSRGYTVGSHRFPAVAVDEAEIEHTLTGVAEIDDIRRIRFNPHKKLRDGYEGMILALGRARKDS